MLLAGKKGIIFGALDDNSIAWKIAERAHQEGASIVLSNAPVALRMGTINQLAEKCNAPVIGADATNMEDLENLVRKAMEHFGGGFDFVLHSIGMSPNVRKKRDYTNDAINEWGSVVGLSYIAAQRTFPGYGDMADAKAALESIARSFGYHYGIKNKVRVNTISQSPTATTAGTGIKGFDDFFDYAQKMSPLGNADANACADYCVAMFSDLTRYVTMQNLFHDGGFSNMGLSPLFLDK